MVCCADMVIHYVMTAKNLIEASKLEAIRSTKFELLHRATQYLNKAEEMGISASVLKELRTVIIDEYLDDYRAFY